MNNTILELFKNAIPLNNKVIAQVIEKEEKQLASGIILTGESVNQAMEDFRRARVIASASPEILVDDVIIYTRFVGDPAGEDIIILNADEILAKEKR